MLICCAFFGKRLSRCAAFGTTGEGPSFSPTERLEALRSALLVRQKHPQFRLLFGTGTPSLEETASLTRAAFDLGVDGVVVLPPYYFRKVSDDGLMAWFSQVIETAVPAGGALLGYHFPNMSGVPLSLDLPGRLKCLPGDLCRYQRFFLRPRTRPPVGRSIWRRSAGADRQRPPVQPRLAARRRRLYHSHGE
jgi:4-hydroxy-tetrahydrodipicolinate synthase